MNELQLSNRAFARRIDDQIPLLCFKLTSEKAAPHSVTFAPGDFMQMLAGALFENLHPQRISDGDMTEVAWALGVAPSIEFEFQVTDCAFGYALHLLRGWHTPRVMLGILDALADNPDETIARYRSDLLVMAIVERLNKQVRIDPDDITLDTRAQFLAAVQTMRSGMAELVGPGRPDDKPQTLFWQHVVLLARRYGCDLKLPRERDGTPTSFVRFAAHMRALALAQGRRLAAAGCGDSRQLGPLLDMPQARLVRILERAKRQITQ